MDESQVIAQLSESISDAASDPEAWPVFLERFAERIGSNSISLHWETMDAARRSRFAFRYGLAAEASEEYERYYGPRNPIVAHAGSLIAPGRGVLRQEACSEEIFRSSEFYNDFLKPSDFLHVLGGTIAMQGPEICMISILGSHKRVAFTEGDKRLLEVLIPHMRTALVLQDRLAAAQQRLLRTEAAFDATPDAAVLVGNGAVVLAANEAARKILQTRDGLYLEQDRLRVRGHAVDAKLSQALQARGGSFRIPRPSGESSWLVQVFPVDKRMPGAAVIFIVPHAATGSLAESDLVGLFDLSPQQARIALLLFEGDPTNDIGDRLGITRHTLKTHLRRLFAKLGITRQTELMRLLAKLKSR